MNIDLTEMTKDDYLIAFHNIGGMPPYDVDAYCDKLMEPLKEVFGCPCSLFPVREGPEWDFVIIRNPERREFLKKEKEKVKKVAETPES